MRSWRIIFLALAMVAACRVCAVLADPFESSSPELILPDPSPDRGGSFPPQLATRDTAYPGVKLDAEKPTPRQACSALSPCAVPTPAFHDSKTASLLSQTGEP